MRHFLLFGLLLFAAAGCTVAPPATDPLWQTANVFHDNPTLVAVADHEYVWETIVDVIDDYFRIEREEPVRLVGNVLTEGRLDTFPEVGSTLFEPWRGDSVGPYERLESTLQSIRRFATVRVMPAENGYWVDVAVFKQLEEVAHPTRATAGAANFRNDSSLTRVVNPSGEQEIHLDWIDLGRDLALEQRILGQLHARLGTSPPCRAPALGVPP